jgi:hypothetical protein
LEGLEFSSVEDTWIKIKDIIKRSVEEKVGILHTEIISGLIRNAQN